MKLFFLLVCSFFFISCSQTFYVVRHAEKTGPPTGTMITDVPLTEGGKQRAEKLKDILKGRKIGLIYSTNMIRTMATAEPTANYFKLSTNIYGPRPDSAFINLLKSKKENILIVGHSNTVDDIVNMLCDEKKLTDLDEAVYDNLFIIKRKGRKFIFRNDKF